VDPKIWEAVRNKEVKGSVKRKSKGKKEKHETFRTAHQLDT